MKLADMIRKLLIAVCDVAKNGLKKYSDSSIKEHLGTFSPGPAASINAKGVAPTMPKMSVEPTHETKVTLFSRVYFVAELITVREP